MSTDWCHAKDVLLGAAALRATDRSPLVFARAFVSGVALPGAAVKKSRSLFALLLLQGTSAAAVTGVVLLLPLLATPVLVVGRA